MASPSASYPSTRNSAGSTTNPGTSDVLADTGALSAGLYEVRICVGCSVAAAFNFQHRNAANGATNETIVIRAAAGQTGEYVFKFNVNTNERLRALPAAVITGVAEITIEATRIV